MKYLIRCAALQCVSLSFCWHDSLLYLESRHQAKARCAHNCTHARQPTSEAPVKRPVAYLICCLYCSAPRASCQHRHCACIASCHHRSAAYTNSMLPALACQQVACCQVRMCVLDVACCSCEVMLTLLMQATAVPAAHVLLQHPVMCKSMVDNLMCVNCHSAAAQL